MVRGRVLLEYDNSTKLGTDVVTTAGGSWGKYRFEVLNDTRTQGNIAGARTGSSSDTSV